MMLLLPRFFASSVRTILPGFVVQSGKALAFELSGGSGAKSATATHSGGAT